MNHRQGLCYCITPTRVRVYKHHWAQAGIWEHLLSVTHLNSSLPSTCPTTAAPETSPPAPLGATCAPQAPPVALPSPATWSTALISWGMRSVNLKRNSERQAFQNKWLYLGIAESRSPGYCAVMDHRHMGGSGKGEAYEDKEKSM